MSACPRCEEFRGKARFCGSCGRFLEAPDVGRLATPGRRLVAAVLDSVIEGGGIFAAIVPSVLPAWLGVSIVGLVSTLYWLFALYLYTQGTTPAKKILAMTVVGADGEPARFFRMVFRETVGKCISGAALGLGFLWILFDRERQGWHDKLFGTYVVVEED